MSLFHHVMQEPPIQARGPELQTVYDLLRRLVSGGVWTEIERRDAIALITELELNNVLGNRAAEITIEKEGGDQ